MERAGPREGKDQDDSETRDLVASAQQRRLHR